MAALEIGPGDEVILPAWTWYSCYNAIVLAGALPVFAEIDESFNIDPADIEGKITPQTKAIMAAHLQGNPGRYGPHPRHRAQGQACACSRTARRASGASYKGRPVGSIGDIGIYSLQINKTITRAKAALGQRTIRSCSSAPRAFTTWEGSGPCTKRSLGGRTARLFPRRNFRMSEFTGGVLAGPNAQAGYGS